MRLPASCSRAVHDPAGAAGGKVCLVEDANGGREASLEFGQRSSAPVPHHSRHLTQPHRARRGDTSADFPGLPMLSSGRQRKSDFLSLEYSSRAHTTAARGQGATDEQIEALKKRGCSEPEVFRKEERCAIRFAEKLTTWPGSLQQSDVEELATCFEAEQIVELVLIIGMVN